MSDGVWSSYKEEMDDEQENNRCIDLPISRDCPGGLRRHTHAYPDTYVHPDLHAHAHTYTHTHAYANPYLHAHTHTHAYPYLHAHTHTHKHPDTHADHRTDFYAYAHLGTGSLA